MSRSLLILGAGSNLAMEVVKSEAEKYDKIILQYYSSSERIDKLQASYGDKIVPFQVDFSDEMSTEQFVEKLKQYKDIESILHLAANKIVYNKAHKTAWEAVMKDMNIQLRSIWKVTNVTMGNMVKRKKGQIVMVLSSCTVNMPPRFLGGYTTCKYALLGFMKALSVEYAEKGIVVNAVSPGMMDTKFLENIPEFVKEDTMNKNPMKRLAKETDVVPMIVSLLSEENTYITGQNIVVSGGE